MLLVHSRLSDGNTKVGLVGPFAVVVRASALALAFQAHSMFLLDNAALVVKGDTCVLLRAWIVSHLHHAFLVLHNMGIGASSAGVLLDGIQLLLLNRSERHFAAHVQERTQLSTNIHLC